MNIRTIKRVGVVSCGFVVGITVAYLIVHLVQLRIGRYLLEDYSLRLLNKSALIGVTTQQAVDAVNHDNLVFCSDQELEFMRLYVYRSDQVKDIGRVKQDGKLYCTTGVGRLATPAPPMLPDITIGETIIGLRRPLLISPKSTGIIFRKDGVSIVMNPAAHNSDEPPLYYSWYLFDPKAERVLQADGHKVPLTDAEVMAGKFIRRNGVYYWPKCSAGAGSCIVAAETRADVVARNRRLFSGYVLGGGLLGAAIALILILFYERQRSVEAQLRRAIRKDKLTLVYQPVVDLETWNIVGAEALVRWENEAGEMVRPEFFVALAEEKGFCNQITELVLRKSLAELSSLLATQNFRLTLNITLGELNDPSFFTLLERSTQSANVQPSTFGLELTERSTADHTAASSAIAQLKRAGYKIYIDDFGTGYSSLGYLHRLEVDAIKIDRVFTQTVGSQAVTASVVPKILAIAAELNLLVVVEGIETSEQAEYFQKAGTGTQGQGWLFSEPVPAAMLESMIRNQVLSKAVVNQVLNNKAVI